MNIQFDNYVQIIFCAIASLGAFLVGFRLLSENLQRVANKGLRKLFERTSGNKMAGVGIGAGATILMQSSAATTVMVIGFVNAGMMTLIQAATIIMGANIGTSVTTVLIATGLTSIGKYVMFLTFIGIFGAMILKSEKAKSWCLTIAGLGLVFMGLTFISACMGSDLIKNSELIRSIFRAQINPSWLEPIVLLLAGMILTALMQSSTAVNGIILATIASGIQIGSGGNAVLFIILGVNVGTCITSLISSVGASTNAKRAALLHFLFNFFGGLVFLIILIVWRNFMDGFWTKLIPDSEQLQIAFFHLAFNSICTLLFLPLTKVLVKLTELIIPEKKQEEERKITYIDDRMLATPTVAIAQLRKETLLLGDRCMESLKKSFKAFLDRDTYAADEINAENDEINTISKQITEYLIAVSGEKVSLHDDTRISILYHAIGDMLRISEISDNLVKYTKTTVSKDLSFSDGVKVELGDMFDKVEHLYKIGIAIFETMNKDAFPELDNLEAQIDEKRKSLIDAHIKRLNDGECDARNSAVFINLVSNLERVGDHITYIAYSINELK